MSFLKRNNIHILRIKILILPLLAITLTVGASLFITKTFVPKQMEDGFRKQLQFHNLKHKEEIILYFDDYRKSSLIAASDPVFLSGNQTEIQDEMKRIVNLSTQISGIVLFNKNGDSELLYPPSEEDEVFNVQDRDYFKQALVTKEAFLSGVIHAKTGRKVLVYGVPVMDPSSNEVEKILGISLHLIEDSFSNYLLKGSSIGFEGTTYLIDSNGVIISHSNSEWIGQSVSDIHPKIKSLHLLGIDKIQRLTDSSENQMLTAYTHIDGMDWGIISEVPISSFKKGNNDLFNKLIEYYWIIALLMIILTVFLTRRVFRPLNELENAMGKMIDGDFSNTIELPYKHDLANSVNTFNRMITMINENRKELELKAFYDSLTGLYNHRMFQEILSREFAVAQKRNRPLSLMFLDIDHFKLVNDQFGHQTGDQILKTVSTIITDSVRPSDIVSRYGGEEIVILCPDTEINTAQMIANRILNSMKNYSFDEISIELNVTASIGIASTENDHFKHKDEFIELADKRMYAAKLQGRDRVIDKNKFIG